MQSKNNIESSKNKLTKKDLEQLVKKDKEVLEFDAIEDQLQELIFQHQKEAPEISFKKCSTSKGISEALSFKEGTFISITAKR